MDRTTIKKRRFNLNRAWWPSELWFAKLLRQACIGGYRRNWCISKRYFGDFVWRSRGIVVEIDGKSHVGKEEYDARRDEFIRQQGYEVFRIPHLNEARALEVIEELKKRIPADERLRSGDFKKPEKRKSRKSFYRDEYAAFIERNQDALFEIYSKTGLAPKLKCLKKGIVVFAGARYYLYSRRFKHGGTCGSQESAFIAHIKTLTSDLSHHGF